jgi:hypothetical protein
LSSQLGLLLGSPFSSFEIFWAHGGEIRIRNMPGKGCVFIIEVPLATEESAPEAAV